MTSRINNISKDHGRSAKDVIFQCNSFKHRDIVLNLYVVPDFDIWGNDYVLSDITVFTYLRVFHDMAEVPYLCVFADLIRILDDCGLMNKEGAIVAKNLKGTGLDRALGRLLK